MAKNDKKAAKRQAKEAKRAQKAERRQQARKARAVLPRSEIADQLRILASQVDSGTIVLGDKELILPAMAEFQIAYRPTKKAGDRIRVRIDWGGTETGLLAPE